tara:strand:+ start:736 stop:984 length:249 start_codon:yes stop_codon:yes gene_type:complete
MDMNNDTYWEGSLALELATNALRAIAEKGGLDPHGFSSCRNLEGADDTARLAMKALSAIEGLEDIISKREDAEFAEHERHFM